MKLAILTGGGDVAPLNAIISSVVYYCNKNDIEIIGYLKGWEGILSNTYIKLNNKNVDPTIGGTMLKSSRINLKKVNNGPETIINNLNREAVSGIIVIGGEDTLSNALYIKEFPKVLISKTIDNDVGLNNSGIFLNHFTIGYPTAAEKIARIVSMQDGLRTTAYSHERIIIVESMGMHAGWLALASSQGSPDFIIIPEFPLDYHVFKEKVYERFENKKNVIVVISEGAKWLDGTWISADESEKDSFGHPRFKGTAEVLAKKLKADLSKYFDTRNVNAVNPSYLYRSGSPNKLDQLCSQKLGMEAVNHLLTFKHTAFLYTTLLDNQFIIEKFNFNNLNDIESFHRYVDNKFYDSINYTVTNSGARYFNTFVKRFS